MHDIPSFEGGGAAAGASRDSAVALAALVELADGYENLDDRWFAAADLGSDDCEDISLPSAVLARHPLSSANDELEPLFDWTAVDDSISAPVRADSAPQHIPTVRDWEGAQKVKQLHFDAAAQVAQQHEFELGLLDIATRHNISGTAIDEIAGLLDRVGASRIARLVADGVPRVRRTRAIVDTQMKLSPGGARFHVTHVNVPPHANILESRIPVWCADFRTLLRSALCDATLCTPSSFMSDPATQTPGLRATSAAVAGEGWDTARLRALSLRVVDLTKAQPYYQQLSDEATAANCRLRVLPVPVFIFGDEAHVGRRSQHATDPWYARVGNLVGPAAQSAAAMHIFAYASRPTIASSGANPPSASALVQIVRQSVLQRILVQPFAEYSNDARGPLVLESLPGAPDVPGRRKQRWIISPFLATLPADAAGIWELCSIKENIICHHCSAYDKQLAEVGIGLPSRQASDTLATFKNLCRHVGNEVEQ